MDQRKLAVIFEFLDNCIPRLVRKPLKYYGDLEVFASALTNGSKSEQEHAVSLLVLVLIEQWPFFIRTGEASEVQAVAQWMLRFLHAARLAGEDEQILREVENQVNSTLPAEIPSLLDEGPLENSLKDAMNSENWRASKFPKRGVEVSEEETSRDTVEALGQVLDSGLSPPEEKDDHPGVTRCMKMGILEAVETGALGELMMCLCSDHQEIRLQAVINLRHCMSRLEVSSRRSPLFKEQSLSSLDGRKRGKEANVSTHRGSRGNGKGLNYERAMAFFCWNLGRSTSSSAK